MGLGPWDTKVGDKMSVLLGLNVPLIWRGKKEDIREGWEVVGEIYVHGIMDGEAIEEWKIVCVDGKIVFTLNPIEAFFSPVLFSTKK